MALAPPTTLDQFFSPAPRNSRKKNQPQNTPTRLLMFQRGKAIDKPTSRTAKTVKVLPTAHREPARMAQITKWGFCRKSTKTYPVPFKRVGNVQRATNTPATMESEIKKGENPAVTNLVGASAPASQVAAPSPQQTPSA